MGAWRKNKVESSQINGGQEYTINSNPSLEQLNAITNNSFYAVDKADEALDKANSAFENNGTVVRVGGSPVTNLGFDSDPQSQINGINKQVNTNTIDIGLLTSDKANKDLSNVTYPQAVADGVARTGDGDRVIETYISSDERTWYRKWVSGWKECGGILSNVVSGYIAEITLPLSFSNTTYTISVTPVLSGNSGQDVYSNWVLNYGEYSITTNKFSYRARSNVDGLSYYCCGY